MSSAPAGEIHDEGEVRATLVDHLDELRTRILRCVVAIAIGWIIGYFIEPWVYEALTQPLLAAKKAGNLELVFQTFGAPFFLKLTLGLMIGVILCAPFIVLQIWGFVKPGLKINERKIARMVGPASVVLFFLGVALAWLILPVGFRWFLSFLGDFEGAKLYQDPRSYVNFVLLMFLAFGAGFQLPIILIAMVRLGVLSEEFLWKNWRQATVVIAVASMLITPSGDAFSMLMMFIPMMLLYFGTAVFIRALSRKDRKLAARTAEDPA